MSVTSIAENPHVALASEKLRDLASRVSALPVSYWRNALFVIAALWLCHSLSSAVWLLIGSPDLPLPDKTAAPVVASSQSGGKTVSFADVQGLSEIFGEASDVPAPVVTPEPVQSDMDNLSTTRLNLKLQGVIASNDPTKGGAIIEEGSDQSFYSVGDELKKNRGVKLVGVMEQRVVIDNKGKRENLWLYSEEDFKKSQSVSSRSSSSRKKVPVNRAPRGGRDASGAVHESIPEENRIRTKARMDQLPKSVGDVVRFSVHREGGKMVGYRIRPGKDKELFEQLGLKTNDIVISVNGIDVDDPKKIRSVYKEVKTAPEAQLTVLRDGQTFSINISVDTGGQ